MSEAPEAGREARTDSPLEFSEGNKPGVTSILGF